MYLSWCKTSHCLIDSGMAISASERICDLTHDEASCGGMRPPIFEIAWTRCTTPRGVRRWAQRLTFPVALAGFRQHVPWWHHKLAGHWLGDRRPLWVGVSLTPSTHSERRLGACHCHGVTLAHTHSRGRMMGLRPVSMIPIFSKQTQISQV